MSWYFFVRGELYNEKIQNFWHSSIYIAWWMGLIQVKTKWKMKTRGSEKDAGINKQRIRFQWTSYFFFWTGGQYLIAQREFLCLSELIFKVFHGCCVLFITPQFSCYQETRRGRRRWSIAVASSVRDQRKYSSPD